MDSSKVRAVYAFSSGFTWITEEQEKRFVIFYSLDFLGIHQLFLPATTLAAAEESIRQAYPGARRFDSWGDVTLYWKVDPGRITFATIRGSDGCNLSAPARSVKSGDLLIGHAPSFFRHWLGPNAVDGFNRLR